MHPTEVQTLIFDRAWFTTAQARAWAKRHGFVAPKVDVKSNTVRLRQRPPGAFYPSTFRTITMRVGVMAVVGVARSARRNPRRTGSRVAEWERFQQRRAADARAFFRSPEYARELAADLRRREARTIAQGHSLKCGLLRCHPECPSRRRRNPELLLLTNPPRRRWAMSGRNPDKSRDRGRFTSPLAEAGERAYQRKLLGLPLTDAEKAALAAFRAWLLDPNRKRRRR